MTAPTRIGVFMIVSRTQRKQRTQSAEAQSAQAQSAQAQSAQATTSWDDYQADRHLRTTGQRVVDGRTRQRSFPDGLHRRLIAVGTDIQRAVDGAKTGVPCLADH